MSVLLSEKGKIINKSLCNNIAKLSHTPALADFILVQFPQLPPNLDLYTKVEIFAS